MDPNNEVPVTKRSKKVKKSSTIKNKKQVIKFDITKVRKGKIFSSKSQFVKYLSMKTKLKFINQRVEEIQRLPDYQKIHNLLNTPRKHSERNPCPWPDDHSSSTQFWNTGPYTMREIEKCILTNDWDNLTRCLIAFKNAPKTYHSYLFKASLLNFMLNPASTQYHLLEDFLTEGMGCQNVEEMVKVISSQFTIPSIQIAEEEKDEINKNINSTENVMKETKNIKKATKKVKNSRNVKILTENVQNIPENVKNVTKNMKKSNKNINNVTENVKNITKIFLKSNRNMNNAAKNVKKYQ